MSFLRRAPDKVRGLCAKVFRLVALGGGLLALIVALDALLSPEGPSHERP